MKKMNHALYLKLSKLLPRLSAKTDLNRLKVLDAINLELAHVGVTWSDITAALEPAEPEVFKADVLLAMVVRIERRLDLLTPAADGFLWDLRERASAVDTVSLAAHQALWLHALHEAAIKREGEPPPPEDHDDALRKTARTLATYRQGEHVAMAMVSLREQQYRALVRRGVPSDAVEARLDAFERELRMQIATERAAAAGEPLTAAVH